MCDVFCTQNKENKHRKTVERREKVKEKLSNGDKTKQRLLRLFHIHCVSRWTFLQEVIFVFFFFTLKQKQKYVEKAIPSIADSIKTVVSLSKNEEFKTKCFRLLEVSL